MTLSVKEKNARKTRIMETCFDYYCDNGLNEIGIKALGKACGMSHSSFYNYFDNLHDLIIQSTEHCMTKVEDEFMKRALSYCKDDVVDIDEVIKFLFDLPYWTAKKHGKKYRLMYQVYSSPQYLEEGKKFFEGVNKRYVEYAKQLEPKVGIPYDTLVSIIFAAVRTSVHYAMFEDEFYLKAQLGLLDMVVRNLKK